MNKQKKRIFYGAIILLFFILICLTICFYSKYKEYENKEKEQIRIYEEEKSRLEEEQRQKQVQEEEYKKFLDENVLDNTIPIGLYTLQNGQYVLTREFSCDWSRDSIFSVFYAIPSTDETIANSEFETIFNGYWNKNEKASEYKIGYNIKFGLDTGEVVNKRVLEPQDIVELFQHIQFYLYDDVTYMPGRPYYHMRQREMTEQTMLTSVKLVGYKETKGVNGPIELSVFTYNGEEDFDSETGEYLGNSKFTTKIYREQV